MISKRGSLNLRTSPPFRRKRISDGGCAGLTMRLTGNWARRSLIVIFGRRGGRMDGKMEGVIDNDNFLYSKL